MKNNAFSYDSVMDKLRKCCINYSKSSPVVSSWADDIYCSLQEDAKNVTVWELIVLDKLTDTDSGDWIHPNYAQNTVYKCMESLQKDTTGILSY